MFWLSTGSIGVGLVVIWNIFVHPIWSIATLLKIALRDPVPRNMRVVDVAGRSKRTAVDLAVDRKRPFSINPLS
jgi:hypothetical protein